MHDTGFPCSANYDAEILILGSMPSRKSLAARQYYAHPQNAFWPIMAELFEFDCGLEYEQRLQQLRSNKIALWDVAHQCVRAGSMDHAIEPETVVANDFTAFFARHPDIRAVFFNGRKAEELFLKLSLGRQQLERHLLPSTSPANARLSRRQKLAAWRLVKQTLETLRARPYLE
jgi:hypoxanthine-DNA glycosylase